MSPVEDLALDYERFIAKVLKERKSDEKKSRFWESSLASVLAGAAVGALTGWLSARAERQNQKEIREFQVRQATQESRDATERDTFNRRFNLFAEASQLAGSANGAGGDILALAEGRFKNAPDEEKAYRTGINERIQAWNSNKYRIEASIEAYDSAHSLADEWVTLTGAIDARLDCATELWNDPARPPAKRKNCDQLAEKVTVAFRQFRKKLGAAVRPG